MSQSLALSIGLTSTRILCSLPIIKKSSRYFNTSRKGAELIKYASNSFLATKISFINEIAGISEKVGGSIEDIVFGLGLDPRIGPRYLKPGIGFGGPCLDKDLRALIRIARENSYDSVMFEGVLRRNELQLREVMNKITQALGSNLYNKRIALLGLSFKEGTNDVRESLSLRLYRLLRDQGASIVGHDYLASSEAVEFEPDLCATDVLKIALKDAEVIVVLNAEHAYSSLDWGSMISVGASPYVIDTRGVLDAAVLSDLRINFDVLGSTV